MIERIAVATGCTAASTPLTSPLDKRWRNEFTVIVVVEASGARPFALVLEERAVVADFEAFAAAAGEGVAGEVGG